MSLINSIKDNKGNYDPAIGAEAMEQAVNLYDDNIFADGSEVRPEDVKAHADSNGLKALSIALNQRYNM